MKNNYKLGALLAILGILAGILTLYFLADTYNTVIHTHFAAGQWEESNTVRIVYALLGWLGTAWLAGDSCWCTLRCCFVGILKEKRLGLVLGSRCWNDSPVGWILPYDPCC